MRPIPISDSAMWKNREHTFDVYGGKQIRYVYYNQLKVFGTTIEDTTVVPNKLVRFANKLHYDTRTWVIKQSLFFREGDTVNAYKLVDNERYLRRLPFIQDARIYVINSYENSDSIDIVVLTKDVFEYGLPFPVLTAHRRLQLFLIITCSAQDRKLPLVSAGITAILRSGAPVPVIQNIMWADHLLMFHSGIRC